MLRQVDDSCGVDGRTLPLTGILSSQEAWSPLLMIFNDSQLRGPWSSQHPTLVSMETARLRTSLSISQAPQPAKQVEDGILVCDP